MEQLKQKLISKCHAIVDSRSDALKQTISELQQSLNSETKSTAGDKHETGRAMVQLEIEKTGHQLSEVEKLKQVLSRIESSSASKHIGLGSIVYTSQHNYFISVSAGAIEHNQTNFFAVSSMAPIAKVLLGKKEGDQVRFRNEVLEIIKIL